MTNNNLLTKCTIIDYICYMPFGAPTKYDKKYCEMLIQHMAEGMSFESFAGEIGVTERTLYNWEEANEDFFHAKKAGFAKSRNFWERIGIQQAKLGQGNSTAFVFNMKNRFPKEWRDKHDDEDGEELKNVTINYNIIKK